MRNIKNLYKTISRWSYKLAGNKFVSHYVKSNWNLFLSKMIFQYITFVKITTKAWNNYNSSRNDVRKSFYKNLLNSAYLWSRARLAIKKSKTISCYQTTNLLKIWFLFLVSMKVQKRNESKLVTKFGGIVVTIIFI